jgi:hypothetical protein
LRRQEKAIEVAEKTKDFINSLDNYIKDLQNEIKQKDLAIETKNNTINDFNFIHADRISKRDIRGKINSRVYEIARSERIAINEVYKKVYKYLTFQHPKLSFYDKTNKLDYLINHGYGDELLEILLMKFGGNYV